MKFRSTVMQKQSRERKRSSWVLCYAQRDDRARSQGDHEDDDHQGGSHRTRPWRQGLRILSVQGFKAQTPGGTWSRQRCSCFCHEKSWIFTISQCFLGNLGVDLIHPQVLCRPRYDELNVALRSVVPLKSMPVLSCAVRTSTYKSVNRWTDYSFVYP